tara:strand:+ start:14758 stop:15537 length:780 start_codon:yes stop_codon:yes gene_type:complete
MKSKLKIIALQIPLFWENPLMNRAYIDKKFGKDSIQADILFLPEMFSTGFTMNAELIAETMDGPTILWMKNWASKLGLLLGGSLVIKDEGKYFNRFVIVGGENILAYYDKRHTFTFAGENKFYNTGTNSGLFEYKGWKICLRICYDLRFPVWSRNIQDYDLLIYVANWPSARINAWDTLLQARAIENMSYVLGANRIGTDDNGLDYPGHSAIYSPLGKSLTEDVSSREGFFKAELDYFELQLLRKQLNFLNDRDSFDLY